MRKEFKEFKKSNKKILILPRDKSVDVISNWKKVKNPLIAPFNFLVIQSLKLSTSSKFTNFILRKFLGLKIEKGVSMAQVNIDPLCPELIEIGENSAIGWKSELLCHGFTQERVKFGKIKIGKNVVIGANSIVYPGVNIGDNSVVAVGSLVTKDIPSNEMWGGNPAKKIKKLENLI